MKMSDRAFLPNTRSFSDTRSSKVSPSTLSIWFSAKLRITRYFKFRKFLLVIFLTKLLLALNMYKLGKFLSTRIGRNEICLLPGRCSTETVELTSLIVVPSESTVTSSPQKHVRCSRLLLPYDSLIINHPSILISPHGN